MNWNPDTYYKNQSVAVEYDRKRFSSLAGKLFQHLERRTIRRCFSSLPAGAVIADAPCGTGRLAESLLASGYRVHGMDVSAEMLEVARERLGKFRDRFACEVIDLKRDRPEQPKYDGALCARVLMHFPLHQQIEFLTGVARQSKSLVVINQSYDSPYHRFRRRVKHWLGHQASSNYPINDAQIQTLLHGAGLREVERYHLLAPLSEAIYIVARRIDGARQETTRLPAG